jgi:hypothetical protein
MNKSCQQFEELSVAEQKLHASHCQVCHHELRWQESERELFRQRTSSAEVGQLWNQFESRHLRGSAHASNASSISGAAGSRLFASVLRPGVLVSVAAGLMLSLGTYARFSSQSVAQNSRESAVMSEVMASYEVPAGESCSKLPDGMGFHCGPSLPESLVASTESRAHTGSTPVNR